MIVIVSTVIIVVIVIIAIVARVSIRFVMIKVQL